MYKKFSNIKLLLKIYLSRISTKCGVFTTKVFGVKGKSGSFSFVEGLARGKGNANVPPVRWGGICPRSASVLEKLVSLSVSI